MKYVNGVDDRTPAAQNITSRFTRSPHLFGRERHVMRPCALEIVAGDFALAGGGAREHVIRREEPVAKV
jgi:hypothetical protein